MNPSYNGSFGDTNSGGVNPGVGGVPQGMQSAQPAPMGMDTGDIILVSDEKKKPKKSRIFLIAGLILLAVVGVLLWQILINNRSGSGRISTNLEKSVNEFTNYMYSGEQSDEVVSGIDDSSVFQFEKMLYSNDAKERNGYFVVANNLLNEIKNNSSNQGGSEDELSAELDGVMGHATFIIDIGSVSILSEDELINLYLASESLDDAEKEVEKVYSPWIGSGIEMIKQYGEDVAMVNTNLLAQMNALKSMGCMNDDGSVDGQCANNNQNYIESSDSKVNEALIRIEDMKNIIDSIKDKLIDEMLAISNTLEGN